MNKLNAFIRKHIFEILTLVVWILIIYTYFHLKTVKHLSDWEIMKKLHTFLKWEWYFSGAFFVFLYMIRTVIFFPSPFLILLAPSLYWFLPWFVFIVIWENLSAALGYLLWKLLWRNIVSDWIATKFKYLKKSFKDNTFTSILTLRLLFVPFDPLSYVSWFFKAKFKWYMLATFFWTLPWILIFLFAWASIKNIDKFDLDHIYIDKKFIYISIAISLLSLIFAFLIKRRQK